MEPLYFLERDGRLYGAYGDRRMILGSRDLRTIARVRTRLTRSRANLDRMPRVRGSYSSKLGAQVMEFQYERRSAPASPPAMRLRTMHQVRDLFTVGRADILLVDEFRYNPQRDVLAVRGQRLSRKDYLRDTDVDTNALRTYFERSLRAS